MRTATDAVVWAKGKKGDVGWRRRCLVFVRSAWDLPAQDGSAQLEWNSIPKKGRHADKLPPVGAPCFWQGPSAEGHVAIVVEYRNGVPQIASNDIVKRDRIDIVPLSRITESWSKARWLGWTTILQGRDLPLGKVMVKNDLAQPDGKAFKQGGKVFKSKMHLGQLDSDSVWNLQRALMNHGIGIRSPKPTGDYLPGTKQAVQKFQLAQGWRGQDADGIAGKQTVKLLGLIWVPE
ncbi:putative peptidoglycan binding protein [Kribbella orskensis]|uniref:Peptidoglycan binding protein n=1 Tax=Kribbella orskensis TaxID=2512216 RepID=A0ABY2BDY6_9ACTN|nr:MULTISPECIES: peptidoglycan-binding protein [Kribbella]TCN35821.1 putative peptidoglycan binding protein [Kribbella sp. VKM Ac-2500]TCO17428.1 putative peptidoglycan binding protein [Kribbella orskensis]